MYKAGDKVKVISKEKFDELCGVRDHIRAAKLDNTCPMTKQMSRFCGKVVTIALVGEDGTYMIKEGRLPRQWWSDSMFEGLSDKEPISVAELEERMNKAKEDLRKVKDGLDNIFDKAIDRVVDQVKEDVKSVKKENEHEASVNEYPEFDTANINKIKQAIQELGDSLISIDKDGIVVKGNDYDIKVSFNK